MKSISTSSNDFDEFDGFNSYLKTTEELAKDSVVCEFFVWPDGVTWGAGIDTSFFCELCMGLVVTSFKEKHKKGRGPVEFTKRYD